MYCTALFSPSLLEGGDAVTPAWQNKHAVQGGNGVRAPHHCPGLSDRGSCHSEGWQPPGLPCGLPGRGCHVSQAFHTQTSAWFSRFISCCSSTPSLLLGQMVPIGLDSLLPQGLCTGSLPPTSTQLTLFSQNSSGSLLGTYPSLSHSTCGLLSVQHWSHHPSTVKVHLDYRSPERTADIHGKWKVLAAQSCLTLFNPVNCSLLGSSVHADRQARILEWVAIPFSRGSFWPRDRTWVPALQADECLLNAKCLVRASQTISHFIFAKTPWGIIAFFLYWGATEAQRV